MVFKNQISDASLILTTESNEISHKINKLTIISGVVVGWTLIAEIGKIRDQSWYRTLVRTVPVTYYVEVVHHI